MVKGSKADPVMQDGVRETGAGSGGNENCEQRGSVVLPRVRA